MLIQLSSRGPPNAFCSPCFNGRLISKSVEEIKQLVRPFRIQRKVSIKELELCARLQKIKIDKKGLGRIRNDI